MSKGKKKKPDHHEVDDDEAPLTSELIPEDHAEPAEVEVKNDIKGHDKFSKFKKSHDEGSDK